MIKITGVPPVKSRVPLLGWIAAGLVTLFSLASSLTPGGLDAVQADQGVERLAQHASMN